MRPESYRNKVNKGRVKPYPMKWKAVMSLLSAVRADCMAPLSNVDFDWREYALLLLAFGTGMRTTDLIERTWEEFIGKDEQGYYPYKIIVIYENKKRRLQNVPKQQLPLFKTFRKLILELYLLLPPDERTGFIFKKWAKYKLGARKLAEVFKRVFETYEVSHPTPFISLARCSWARAIYDHLVLKGMPEGEALMQVSQIMNHSSTRMTMNYLGLGINSPKVQSVMETISMISDDTEYVPREEPLVATNLQEDKAVDELFDWNEYVDLDTETIKASEQMQRKQASVVHRRHYRLHKTPA